MIFGFNTDVQGKDAVYHVQTEDRGQRNPVIESIVYVGGKILGKKRTPYDPATTSKDQIEDAVRHQHKELMEAVRNGTWQPTPAQTASSSAEHVTSVPGHREAERYVVELTNPGSFQQGDYFRFQLSVKGSGNNGATGNVPLEVRWLVGGQVVDQQSLTSRADGGVDVWVSANDPTQPGVLMIQATGSLGKSIAKFTISQVG